MYINKAFLFGNLTRDPEVRSLPSGIAVTSFSIATNRTWKDKEGRKQESTDYHNIVAFGKPGEVVAQYARKGSSLFVEGRIQTRSWEAADGQKKYRTEIVLDNFQFGPRKEGQGGGSYEKAAASASAPAAAAAAQEEAIEYPTEETSTEDIPF